MELDPVDGHRASDDDDDDGGDHGNDAVRKNSNTKSSSSQRLQRDLKVSYMFAIDWLYTLRLVDMFIRNNIFKICSIVRILGWLH